MTIHVLPVEIASQIAAGEVVERPASVIKELLENSLDAKGKVIIIEIRGAGRTFIRVSDDGDGIPENELSIAVQRHATSKISTAEELFRITTLGFRGEALASISSVARMTIISRTRDAIEGSRLLVEGSRIGKVEKIGAPHGTTITVEDLFYNVPARLRFLKQDLTERRVIFNLVTRYALAYPHVRIQLIEEGTSSFHTSGDGNRRAILASLYGVETAQDMLEARGNENGLKLSGFISPITISRSSRKEISFFINGRLIQDASLSAAIIKAYHTLLMVGRFPLVNLFLDIPPDEVDVNVHPAKAEVRFHNPEKVFSFIQRMIKRALLAYSPIPKVPPYITWGGLANGSDIHLDLQQQPSEKYQQEGIISNSLPIQNQAIFSSNVPLMRLVGQIGASYIVAEGPDGLYLIDQHAAHERILFEKLIAQKEQNAIASQVFLSPLVIEMAQITFDSLQNQLKVLKKFGFEIESFGQHTIRVNAFPSIFNDSDPTNAILSLVDEFEEDETPFQNKLESKIAARICKRMAIKAGQLLTQEEQYALIRDLEACVSPRTCPHGRPTLIHLSVDMLERQFGRKGAK